jgi:hypothetical protein
MKKTIMAATVIVAAFAIIGGIFGIAAPVVAISHETMSAGNATPGLGTEGGGTEGDPIEPIDLPDGIPSESVEQGMSGDMMSMLCQSGDVCMFGMISSIQNDEQGQPAWIVSGHWMMEMESAPVNFTTVSGFHAMLHMVRLNGSDMHTHEISNFTESGDTIRDINSTRISGIATVTMPEGPVQDVSTNIEIRPGLLGETQESVIAISLDPAALENHFGDTPIYGIVVSPEMIEEMMMMMQEPMDGGMMMNSSEGM